MTNLTDPKVADLADAIFDVFKHQGFSEHPTINKALNKAGVPDTTKGRGADLRKIATDAVLTAAAAAFAVKFAEVASEVTKASAAEFTDKTAALQARLDAVVALVDPPIEQQPQLRQYRKVSPTDTTPNLAAHYSAAAQATADPVLRAGYEAMAARALQEQTG